MTLPLFPFATAEIATTKTVTMIVDQHTVLEEDFLEFWKAYPRRVDKKRALVAYRHARRNTDAQTILAGAHRYATVMRLDGRESQHIKHPTTWLNGDCWEDEEVSTRRLGNDERALADYLARQQQKTGTERTTHQPLPAATPPPPPPGRAEPLPMPRRQPDAAFDSLWSAQTGVTLEQLQEARTQATHVMHYVALVTDLLDQQKQSTQ